MKVGRNTKTREMREYWAFLEKTAAAVALWPKWKQDLVWKYRKV